MKKSGVSSSRSYFRQIGLLRGFNSNFPQSIPRTLHIGIPPIPAPRVNLVFRKRNTVYKLCPYKVHFDWLCISKHGDQFLESNTQAHNWAIGKGVKKKRKSFFFQTQVHPAVKHLNPLTVYLVRVLYPNHTEKIIKLCSNSLRSNERKSFYP